MQDEESDLTWTMAEGTQVAFNNDDLLHSVINGQDVTITPNVDQFGTQVFSFEVTDSNGLSDTHNITFTVNNINDAPVICNVCLLYTSPSPRDKRQSRMPSSA